MEESSKIAGASKQKQAAKKMEESSKIAGASKHKTADEKMGESNERADALKKLKEISKSTIKRPLPSHVQRLTPSVHAKKIQYYTRVS